MVILTGLPGVGRRVVTPHVLGLAQMEESGGGRVCRPRCPPRKPDESCVDMDRFQSDRDGIGRNIDSNESNLAVASTVADSLNHPDKSIP